MQRVLPGGADAGIQRQPDRPRLCGRGQRYADLENAFVYRQRIVEGCSCNGKDSFGLARIDVASDPTLRPGDIVSSGDNVKAALIAMHAAKERGLAAAETPGAARLAHRDIRAGAARREAVRRAGGGAGADRGDRRYSGRLILYRICPTTSAAIDSAEVRPGDSIPNRCTSRGTPCASGPSIKKSAAASPLPVSLGRMPQ